MATQMNANFLSASRIKSKMVNFDAKLGAHADFSARASRDAANRSFRCAGIVWVVRTSTVSR